MIKNFADKKIALIGVSKSNIALAKFLYSKRVKKFVFCDENKKIDIKSLKFLPKDKVRLKLGEDYLSDLSGFDLIFISPGINRNIKEIKDAQKKGIIISSEIEVFFLNCPARIIGITGTNGKSTTTALIGETLKRDKKKVWIGGNIGEPLVDKLDKITKNDLVVLELSSFQLENLKISPHIAVVLNISEDHIDRHQSLKNYIDAKVNIVRYQDKNDLVVLNFDDREVLKYKNFTKGKVIFFSLDKIKEGIFLKDKEIYYKDKGIEQKICLKDDIRLIGEHNLSNALAAIAVALNLRIDKKDIVRLLKKFKGLEHRIEFIREKQRIKFYNDSKATTPESTIAAIKCFPRSRLVLILGGYDKKIDFKPLISELKNQKVLKIILIGETAKKIYEIIKKQNSYSSEVCICSSFKQAVEKSFSISKKGDTVLLSPACASYDMFKNFEERGRLFKEMVKKL